jgi:NAD(P)-dependent dehydrogenase (short-subunit alcohol dehydrogenase family)
MLVHIPARAAKGRIINNGSLSAHTPRPMTIPYTVSKHGITGLSKCIALDGRAFDITCTQIDIGTRSFFSWPIYIIARAGNATTALTAVMGQGMLQGDGRFVPEATFDVAHVAAAVVHIASLPPDVAVPHFTIMCVHKLFRLQLAMSNERCRASKAPFAGRG